MWFDYLHTIRNNFRKGFMYWLVPIKIKKGNIVSIHKNGDKQVLKKLPPRFIAPNLWENFLKE